MSEPILETERAELKMMTQEQLENYFQLFKQSKADLKVFINKNIEHQEKHHFSLFSVFLKDSGQFIGYCGCTVNNPEEASSPEFNWDIYKEYKGDDIDLEIIFAVRNYMFRNFDITSLYTYVDSLDPLRVYLSEEIDMDIDKKIIEGDTEWWVYRVSRDSEQFKASFGDGESEPMLTSARRRNEKRYSPGAHLRRLMPKPPKKK